MKSTKKPYSSKRNPKVIPFVVESILKADCKRFLDTAIRKNFNLKAKTMIKKLTPIHGKIVFINTLKKLEAVAVFLHLCSTNLWAQTSKVSTQLKMFRFFAVFALPKTHFRHMLGHRRASALTGVINIFQSTFNTVHEVEHHKDRKYRTSKTVKFVFRSNERDISSQLSVELDWKPKKYRKYTFYCKAKDYQSILQLAMAKMYRYI